jgi:SAM-dependent methyltransferase
VDALTRALVEGLLATLKLPDPVVEIGSLQVNGDATIDLRPLFPRHEFIGCDMRPGPGVDRIENLESLRFADGYAGTILCLNVIEHAWDFRRGIDEILRVTAPGGAALVSTAFTCGVHGYPEDYWRFTPRAMERLLEGFPSRLYGWQGHGKAPRLVWALGLKERRDDLPQLAEAWRGAILERWGERPTWLERLGASLGGSLFGKRHFRVIRHFAEVTIRPGGQGTA